MLKIAFDNNILLDAIANRADYKTAQKLFMAVADEKITGIISANTITDIYYISRKILGDKDARKAILNLLTLFEVVPVDEEACLTALNTPMSDFEDSVLAVCALNSGADYIVTRDKDFIASTESPVEALSPFDILKIISNY
ncbi:MAG: PIN domain-containing protein [Clostridiales bacterium]|nr:PIN domain-containing protein [Clostridiales bacterium]